MAEERTKPVILLAFANNAEEYLRSLANEAHSLRDVLTQGNAAKWCEVVLRENCTAGDIFKVLQDPQYRNRIAIFHYGGHANAYQLLLESANGEGATADAGGLAKFLSQQRGLQLVFLNGCSTQQQTQGLLDAGVGAVISTSRAIRDEVATTFALHFYQAIAGGASIRTAYIEAEASVQRHEAGNMRGLYFGDRQIVGSPIEEDRLPWQLFLREGSESTDKWNLPEVADDALFGLPSLPLQDLPESPYRYLKWFSRRDAEVFFGRSHQIRELFDRLTAPRTPPILLFYGQSGVGKSSILDAGLMPRLEQDHEVRYLRRTEGGLLDTLRMAFLPEAVGAPDASAWQLKEEVTGKPLVVILDQVEEVFTRPIVEVRNELEQFLGVLVMIFGDAARRPKGKLVLGFRKEWLAEIEKRLISYELPRSKVFLEPLNRKGIMEAVRGPMSSDRLRQHYGLQVETGLAEIIADDLAEDRDSAIAPTLQILLTKLWSRATQQNYERPEFTGDLYRQLKRDGILLRDFLNQQVETFRQKYPEVVDSGLLLDIVALHTTALGTADQQTVEQLQQQYAHLGATLPELIQQCQDLHLLTVTANSQKEGETTTRLAHDTLAPLVREQFDTSDKPGQRARRILDNRSVDWSDEATGTPLDDADLSIVERGVSGTRQLTPTEQRLLAASRELRLRIQRTKRTIRVAIVVAAVVILIVSAIAMQKSTEARQANLTAILTASPAELETALATIDHSTAEVLRTVRDDEKLGSTARLHAAFGLAHFGESQDLFLVEYLHEVTPEEMPNLLRALSAKLDESLVQTLSEIANGEVSNDSAQPVRAASVLVALGQADHLRRLEQFPPNGDPRHRTHFVHDYHRWIGDVDRLREALTHTNNTDALAAICLSLSFSESKQVQTATQDILAKHLKGHRSAAVRSASRCTLHSWGAMLADANAKLDESEGRDWYTNGSGITMIAVPFNDQGVGTFQWIDVKNTGKAYNVTLKRKFHMAETEVTFKQWSQWPERPNIAEDFVGREGRPIDYISFYDSINYCNWLSEQEGLPKCYSKDDAGDWTCNFDLNGYRLPTEAEWRYACRAGTTSRYCFGDDPDLTSAYAWTTANAHGQSHDVATRQPNAWGFFDMHGNVLEWCWDWYVPVPQAAENEQVPNDYAGPLEPDPAFRGRVVCGGNFNAGTADAISDDRDLRPVKEKQPYLGFRVARTRNSTQQQ
ncbi:MAG: SUMF1/EgtB/PvdO family nonheme iron enzyme [Planctomycetaceae bacterium]